jgi:hypothetical protein
MSIQCLRSLCSISASRDDVLAAAGSSCCRLLLPQFLEEIRAMGKSIKLGKGNFSIFDESIKALTSTLQILEDSQKRKLIIYHI